MARRMVIEAQDAGRIVNLDHLVFLISSTTTTCIDRKRVLIDDLWGPIRNLRRLVSRGNELRRKVSERGLWRRIKLGDHLLGHLPKERQVPLRVLMKIIVHECRDTLVIIVSTDLFELS